MVYNSSGSQVDVGMEIGAIPFLRAKGIAAVALAHLTDIKAS